MLCVSEPFVTPPHGKGDTRPIVVGFLPSLTHCNVCKFQPYLEAFLSIHSQELEHVLKQLVFEWGPDRIAVDLNRLSYLRRHVK